MTGRSATRRVLAVLVVPLLAASGALLTAAAASAEGASGAAPDPNPRPRRPS